MHRRKIPTAMASQHPDHAQRPYYHHTEFISTSDEIKECYVAFSQLGISECMWDWEGKLVDESVIEKLLGRYHDFFRQHQLGKDTFLTFRIPNVKIKNEFRLGRALMVVLSAANFAKQAGLYSQPLFEIIMPMVSSAREMMSLQEAFQEITSLKHSLYHFKVKPKAVEVIPLFEDVDVIINSDKILQRYLTQYQQQFGELPPYIRPFLARSDPALSAGLVPAVLATKIALSRYRRLAEKSGVPLFPIIGPGSLPFRGGFNPDNVAQFIQEYPGVRTVLLQSAFRYDYELDRVKHAVNYLEKKLPQTTAQIIPSQEEKKIKKIVSIFKECYQETVETIATEISDLASQLPQRRERLRHIGSFKYARTVKKKSLPRAIGFTGALYSLGVPPELVGTGRGLAKITELGLLDTLEKYYRFFRQDITQAGSYLNAHNLRLLTATNSGWSAIQEDITHLEKYLSTSLQPRTAAQQEHSAITQRLYSKFTSGQELSQEIQQAAMLRKSLG